METQTLDPITLHVNESKSINLGPTPLGYVWASQNGFHGVEFDTYTKPSSINAPIGAAIEEDHILTGKHPGTHEVEIRCFRVWEGWNAADREVKITVTVISSP